MKTLYYDNVVRRGGISHTLECLNFAYRIASEHGYRLIFIPSFCGHGLGTTGRLEQFFGLEVSTFPPKGLKEVSGAEDLFEILPTIKQDSVMITRSDFNPLHGDFTVSKPYYQQHFNKSENHDIGSLKEGYYNIGVHIRRGDVVLGQMKSRLVSDEWYVSMVKWVTDYIRRVSPSTKISINIFTEGLEGEYVDQDREKADIIAKFLDSCDVIDLHMDGCPYWSLVNLAAQDMIIGGKSGFSSVAALFSESVKLLFSTCPGRAFGGTTRNHVITDNTGEGDIEVMLDGECFEC
jgi:hypothetical protein